MKSNLKNIEENIKSIREIYKLKNIERFNKVKDRRESSAEHSWSCIVLADYYLTKINDKKINREKVYELLLYHDLVEIHSGDVGIDQDEARKAKSSQEMKAAKKLKKLLPKKIGEKYFKLFVEYEQKKTKEAKIAKAIDKMDALIHELDYKTDWKGWDEKKLRKYFEQDIKNIKEIKLDFEDLITYAKKKGYLKG